MTTPPAGGRATSSNQFVREVMNMRTVTRKLDDVAARVAVATRRIGAGEGLNASVVQRSSGVRPGAHSRWGTRRPYSRVTLADGASEFGDSQTARHRVLGRAASGVGR